MLRNQKHRGPDGTSWFGMSDINNFYFIKDNNNININQNLRFTFGCSRLAINDISDLGMQPISSSSEKILVCMNGEIFNFLEIKEKLKINIILKLRQIQRWLLMHMKSGGWAFEI